MARSRATRRPTPARAVVDSGPLIALFNASDRWHAPVVTWLREHQNVRLVTTWAVLTEVCALLARRLHNEAALDFLRWTQRGALEVDRAEVNTLANVLAISERFAALPFDLADASVAEAAARLRIGAVVSIDADFDVYRDLRGKPLVNLLRPGK
ncbi:MAG TPA: PIN domain-containing protein [Burkholderiaceae bacterium]|nr:PIN domain-containing protein [Burkholderiaceae bacterium]